MDNTLIVILVLLVVIICCTYIDDDSTVIISTHDGEPYVVEERYDNPEEAFNILARLNEINETLISHLLKKYVNSKYERDLRFLKSNYNGNVLQEHTPTSTVNTSYVLNKGDEIRLCLRDQRTKQLHSFDILLFVNLHELSHMLDRQYGHNNSFWTGFKFILHEAYELGLYNPVDYSKNPATYCGLTVTSNPFFREYNNDYFSDRL